MLKERNFSLIHFGTTIRLLVQGLELAGLIDSRSRLNIPDENLFANLLAVWQYLEHQPKYDEMQKPISKYFSSVYEDRLGSWSKAPEKFIEYNNAMAKTVKRIARKSIRLN